MVAEGFESLTLQAQTETKTPIITAWQRQEKDRVPDGHQALQQRPGKLPT